MRAERSFRASDARSGEAVSGACLCGAVRFAIEPPYRWFAHCHCSMCRKQHGSLFGTGLGVARAAFRWLDGASEIVHYRATAAFERPFCRHCGSTVPAVSHDDRYWHVPAGLLDGDPGARPRSHIFAGSRSRLSALDDTLPRHNTYPPGIELPTLPARAPLEGAAVSGSCLCGSVTFAASVLPQRLVNCYCSLCRRSRAAAFASTLHVPRESFAWRSGVDGVRRWSLPAPSRYFTCFCGVCGSPVPSSTPNDTMALPAGAIDTPLPRLATLHLHVDSKAPWYEIAVRNDRHEARPRPERFTAADH